MFSLLSSLSSLLSGWYVGRQNWLEKAVMNDVVFLVIKLIAMGVCRTCLAEAWNHGLHEVLELFKVLRRHVGGHVSGHGHSSHSGDTGVGKLRLDIRRLHCSLVYFGLVLQLVQCIVKDAWIGRWSECGGCGGCGGWWMWWMWFFQFNGRCDTARLGFLLSKSMVGQAVDYLAHAQPK